jgi:isoleucyl-tRNA synthetase
MWDYGRLYEDYKVLPYCPRDGTALSSHEVALGYQDVEDPSVYVKLPVREAAAPLEDGDQLLVWTTTPWTLITNAAVAAGGEISYVRARLDGEVFLLARDRLEHVLGEEARFASFPRRGDRRGLLRAALRLPSPTTAPGGHTVLLADSSPRTRRLPGPHRDRLRRGRLKLGEQYGITLRTWSTCAAASTSGSPTSPAAASGGGSDIIKALEEKGKLLRAEKYLHSYPHCWRCDTPLIYYAKASWYVKTTEVRDRMLATNEEIGWHPEHIKHGRFGKWLEGNVDWALSRDRYWGTPLPIWECDQDDCNERFCAGSIAELREKGRRDRT